MPRLLDVSDDCCQLLASSAGRLALLSRAGAALHWADIPAQAARFLAADRILAAAPTPPSARPFSTSHDLFLLDAELNVLDRQTVDADEATAYITKHPTEPAAVVDLPMGQDGNILLQATVEGRRLGIEEVLRNQDVVMVSFNNVGKQLLLTPYPSDMEQVMICAWPSLELVSTLQATDLDLEIGFDLSGGYLGDGRVLTLAAEEGPVLSAADLSNPRRVELVDLAQLFDDGYVETIAPLDDDLFAAVIWDKTRTTTVWRIPS